MKKTLLLLTPLLIFLSACNSKPSFDTDLLLGEWYYYDTFDIDDEDEEYEVEGEEILRFINEKEFYSVFTFSIDGEHVGDLICEGEYEVIGNTIKYNVPESKKKLTLNKDYYESSLDYNYALKELEKTDFFTDDKVVSISAQTLVLEDEDGEREYEKL